MNIIHAENHKILPGKDISAPLHQLLKNFPENTGETTLLFQKGTYYLNALHAEKHILYITNTAADDEYKEGETPHRQTVALYLQGAKNLTIDGAESIFVLDGRATHLALEHCENLTL